MGARDHLHLGEHPAQRLGVEAVAAGPAAHPREGTPVGPLDRAHRQHLLQHHLDLGGHVGGPDPDARGGDLVLDRLHDVNHQVGTTIVLVTHDAEVAARLPRTVTIRDGRVSGEGRRGEEYAVVSADGSLPLPDDVLDDLPPGTLVRVHRDGDRWTLITEGGTERD